MAVLLYVPVAAAGLQYQTPPELGQQATAQKAQVLSAEASPFPASTATPSPSPTPTPVLATPRPKAAPQVPASAPAAAAPATSDIASEAACPGQGSLASAKPVIACMTAYARTYHGLKAVSANASLMAAADAKVADMVKCGYSHTACGLGSFYWIGVKGYTEGCVAENIAAGSATPRAAFVLWMNSPGHRANILNPKYDAVGAGVAPDANGKLLWAMELGGC